MSTHKLTTSVGTIFPEKLSTSVKFWSNDDQCITEQFETRQTSCFDVAQTKFLNCTLHSTSITLLYRLYNCMLYNCMTDKIHKEPQARSLLVKIQSIISLAKDSYPVSNIQSDHVTTQQSKLQKRDHVLRSFNESLMNNLFLSRFHKSHRESGYDLLDRQQLCC